MLRRVARGLTALAMALLASGALAAVTPSGEAPPEMRFSHAASPWIGQDWSLLIRVVPWSAQQEGTVLRLDAPESLWVRREGGRWVVSLAGVSGTPLTVFLPVSAMPIGQVAYLAVNFDAVAGTMTVRARDHAMTETATGSATAAGFTPAASTQVALYAGLSDTPFDGACDVIVRSHTLSSHDFDLLWSRGRVADPVRGDLDRPEEAPRFDLLPGPTNAGSTTPIVLAVGYGLTTRTLKGFTGAEQATPALDGLPVTSTNALVFNRYSTRPTSFYTARTMMVVQGLRYLSPHPLFGQRDTTDIFEGSVSVAGPAPIFRDIARRKAPDGLRTVLIAGNSRAVRTNDGLQRSGAICTGVALERPELVAGLASFRGDGIGSAAIPLRNALGTVGGPGGTNFTRACSHGQAMSPGPGTPCLLPVSNSFVEVSFQEAPGTLYTNDRAVVVRALVLRYPGSAGALPRRVTQASASAQRVFVNEPTVSLSNTALEADVLDAGDASLVVTGDATGVVAPGWLVAGVQGATPGGINQVQSLIFDGEATHIMLRHPWDTRPTPGDTVGFGPYEFQWISTEHAGGGPPIRGLRVQQDPQQPGSPVCVVSWQTFALGVDGYVFGGHGTGGAGYSEQIAEGFAGMHPTLVRALGVDAVGVTPANQDTDPDPYLGMMLDEFAQVEGLEIVALGDIRFPQAEVGVPHFLRWHNGLRAEATARGLAFATAIESAEAGTGWDYMLAGETDDAAHPNLEGHQQTVRVWLDLLADAALPGCLGDATGDGVVNFLDLNAVLSEYGAVGSGLLGDVTGDGVVGFLDLNAVLTGFGTTCP